MTAGCVPIQLQTRCGQQLLALISKGMAFLLRMFWDSLLRALMPRVEAPDLLLRSQRPLATRHKMKCWPGTGPFMTSDSLPKAGAKAQQIKNYSMNRKARLGEHVYNSSNGEPEAQEQPIPG